MKDSIRFTLMSCVIVALLLGLCFMASGQTYGPCPGGVCPTDRVPTYTAPAPRPATWCDLRIKVDDRDNGNSWGSGTPVRKYNGGTIVLTNCHVVDSRVSDTSITVYRQNSPPVGATVLGADKDLDVAVLLVDADWPVVNLGDSFDETGTVQTRGFAHAKTFTVFQGRVTARIRRGYFVSTPAINGMSGGGVFQNQKYVGILWGGASDYTAVTTVTHIRPFLDRLLGRQRVDVIVTPKPTPAPPQQPNTPPPVCPDCPQSCNCDERISKLVDLQADLVIKVQSLEQKVNGIPVGERGPVGPAGPQGPQGARGPAGKDADTAELELRITALESQLAEIRATTPVSWDIVPRKE